MKHWWFLAAFLWPAASMVIAEAPLPYVFPEHPPVPLQTFGVAQASIAKVRKGMTRKELLHNFRPAGSLLSAAETYYYSPTLAPDERRTLFLDIVFRPASMDEAAYAKSFSEEKQRRSTGLWPMADAKDVIVAVSQPYFGQRSYGDEVDVSELPASARKQLQTLKVGITRSELQHSFDPTAETIYPPVEDYTLHGAKIGYDRIAIQFTFKPAAMDSRTYADADLRAEWFRRHAWLPGEDLDDTLMDFSRLRRKWDGADETVVDTHQFSEEARELLKIIKVGATRKQVERVYGMAAGLNDSFRWSLYNARFNTGIRIKPFECLSVAIDFAPAGTHWTPPEVTEHEQSHRFLRAKADDVVIGFSRPFTSSRGTAID